jgi:hypothetical protein
VLDHVNILIGELSGGLLGATTGTTIVLDGSAAGWGWFVDATPLDNAEFRIAQGNGVFAANGGSPAAGHMDLLSTVLHELGNAMGFAEDQGQDVTGAVLQPGVRRLPTFAAASADGTAAPAGEAAASIEVAQVAAPAAANATAIADLSAPPGPVSAPPSGSAPVSDPLSVDVVGGQDKPAGIGVALSAAPDLSTLPGPVLAPPSGPVPVPYPLSVDAVGGQDKPAGIGVALGTAAPAAAPNAAPRDSYLGGSFIALGPLPSVAMDLGNDWSTSPGVTLPSSLATPETDPAPLRHSHSSTPAPSAKPAIAWDGDGSSLFNGAQTGDAGQPQDWLQDFLNHLGQEESRWNPNAGLRLRPAGTKSAG